MNRPGERGLIGKIMVIWLLVLVIFGVLAVDGISIVRAHVQLSSVADDAARAGADAFHANRNVNTACGAAAASVAKSGKGHRLAAKKGCTVNTQTGEVTVSVRMLAWTLLVGRIGPLRKFSRIREESVAGPPLL